MSTLVKVERTQQIEVPGLGAAIRKAREADTRPLREIANQAGMTTANWYRIENEEVKRLPEETLRAIERVLQVDLGVRFE